MDQPAQDVPSTRAPESPDAAAVASALEERPSPGHFAPHSRTGGGTSPRRRGAAGDLTVLALVGVLLLAALAAAGYTVYREFYSATAFVERYLGMLSDGRAADALAVPGVAVDSSQLEAVGLPASSSEALLRSAVLRSLDGVRTVSEVETPDVTTVTVEYTAGGYRGSTAFEVERAGWIGAAPAWRFARSPLAVVELEVAGSMSFTVNGFELDKRQVSPDGADADPAAAVPLLVFSPGAYTVAVDTALAATSGVAVLADVPLKSVPVDVRAEPTARFVEVVQERVAEFFTACTAQRVLQPTGCPFGFVVQNRIDEPPLWSIVEQPTVTLVPDGADWRIPPTRGTAHISVGVRSLFDGTLRQVEEDVPFAMGATITVQPDGSAAITVNGGE